MIARLEAALARHWVAAAGVSGVLLLALAPVLAARWSLPLLLIFLASPAYMLHQVEEHQGDRFRRFVNRMFGCEVLTVRAVLVINLPGVWGVNLAALYAAAFAAPGDGLAAPYLMLVNAAAHAGAALRLRCYNPGLVTALCVLAPLGAATLALCPASLPQQAAGLVIAVAIHAAILLHLRIRARLDR